MSPQESPALLEKLWLRTFLVLEVLGTGAIWILSQLLKALETSFHGLVSKCKLAVVCMAASVWELAAEQLDQVVYSWDHDEGHDFDCICDVGGFVHVEFGEEDKEDASSSLVAANEERALGSMGLISFYPGRFVDDDLAARIQHAAKRRIVTPLSRRSCLRTVGCSSRPCTGRRLRWAEVTPGDVQEYQVACTARFRSVSANTAAKERRERDKDSMQSGEKTKNGKRHRSTMSPQEAEPCASKGGA